MSFKLSPSSLGLTKDKENGRQKFLTKSSYVSGLQCSKWLWLKFNKPEELPLYSHQAQHLFNEGNKVGEFAKSLFPDGIQVKEQLNSLENDKESRELLRRRKTLFEAGFIHKDGKCYARADILVPIGEDEWDIYEVKGATSVKEEYPWDVAFQRYCYESAGLKIRECFVIHINNQYVRQGKINARDFFVMAPVTDLVNEELKNVDDNVKKLFKIVDLKECPEFKKGEECHEDDFNVHQNDQFWKDNPHCDILDLYWGGKSAIALFNAGVLSIKDMNEDHFTTRPQKKQQKIQHKVHTTGESHHDKKELGAFINSLKYPLYFMDFETYATAIPLYDYLKPYQAIPFQFSVHVIEKQGDKPKHYSFIASGVEDPRPAFAAELKRVLGNIGTVLAYYQTFEKSRLKELAEFFPENATWVEAVLERMRDLYDPFKNFAYYHPSQKGSASLKKVLPALTGKGYDDMDISDGTQASLQYLFITHGSYEGKKATPEEAKKILADLEEYCGQDTEGMVWILEKLKELVK